MRIGFFSGSTRSFRNRRMSTHYYVRKSFYKLKELKFSLLSFSTFFFLMEAITVMCLLQNTIMFQIGFIFCDLICLIYFLLRTVFIKRSIEKNQLVLTDYSNRILKRHYVIISIFIIMIAIHIGYIIANIALDLNQEIKTWIWFAILLPVLYSDSVYISGITAFGEEMYASGEYIVYYSDIDQITEIWEKRTTSGNIVLMTLWKDGRNIGYDKMFSDEYVYFRKKVFNL